MAGDQERLSLRDADAIDVGYVTGFHILLRAIHEAMPPDAVLFLEGPGTAPAIADFLRRHAATEAPVMEPNSRHPTDGFHIPLRHLAALLLLAEDHPSPEIAVHLAVHRDREVLLWAHDAGYGRVLVARSLSDETIERFRDALGSAIRPPKRHGLLSLFRTRDH
jgi:hypothetical protein